MPADCAICGALFAIAYYYFDWNLSRTFHFSWLSRWGARLSAAAVVVNADPRYASIVSGIPGHNIEDVKLLAPVE